MNSKEDSELEDGEIREEDFEQISDCSLSDILPEDLSDDNDVDKLRQEALKSLNQEDELNEEDIYRLEALKSLLKNTDIKESTIDDLNEEEQYRLEAIKSLLLNTESSEFKIRPKTEPSDKPVIEHVNGKKRKTKRKRKPKKRPRSISDLPLPNAAPYLKETTSFLSGLSEDVKKINKTLENQKSETINKENSDVKFEPNVSLNSLRSWYPKREFTLLDISSMNNVEVIQSFKEVNKVIKEEKVDIKMVIEDTKVVEKKTVIEGREVKVKKFKKVRFADEIDEPLTLVSLPIKPINQPCEIKTKPQITLKPKLPSPIKTTVETRKSVEINSSQSRFVPPKSANVCHFQRFGTTKFSTPVSKNLVFHKKEKYKLNNVTKSRYKLRKTTPKVDVSKLKLVNNKSRYSFNPANFPKIPLKTFLIPLQNDESSTDEENTTPVENTESQVSSSIVPKSEEIVIKEEPRDCDEPEMPSITITTNPCIVVNDTLHSAQTFETLQNKEVSSVINGKVKLPEVQKQVESLPPKTKDENEISLKGELELLVEAEENLIEIRSKLLSSLDELGVSIKNNTEEKERLCNMVKKLNLLKASIKKFEEKIKTQKMKLAMSNSFMRSLFEGVTLRSKTCSKMKDLCSIAGKKIVGPQYKPPEEFEAQLEEKRKTVDFSKYVSKPAEQK